MYSIKKFWLHYQSHIKLIRFALFKIHNLQVKLLAITIERKHKEGILGLYEHIAFL